MQKRRNTRFGKQVQDGMVQVLLFSLVFIGLVLLLSPWLTNVLLKDKNVQFQVDGFSLSELEKNNKDAKNVLPEEDIAIPDFFTILTNIGKARRSQVIGTIHINEVGIHLPVFNGITKGNLLAGTGTINAGQVMGQDNYALAGHHMRDTSILFGPLLKVKEGTKVQLSDGRLIYTYEVEQVQTVHQTDIQILESIGRAGITLVTCNKTGVNTEYRWAVTGSLVNISSLSAEGENTLDKQSGIEVDTQKEYVNLYQEGIEAAAAQKNIPIGIILIFLAIISKLIVSAAKKWIAVEKAEVI